MNLRPSHEKKRRGRLRAALLCACSVLLPAAAIGAPLTPSAPTSTTVDPISAEIQFNRSIIDCEFRRYDAALEKTTSLDGQKVEVAYYRGILLMNMGRHAEAVAELQKVRHHQQAPAEVQIDLAIARLQAGDARGAETELKGYLSQNPGDKHAHYLLGLVLVSQNRKQEAIAELKLAGIDAADVGKAIQPVSYNETLEIQTSAAAGAGCCDSAKPSCCAAATSCTSGSCCATACCAPPPRRWNLTVLSAYEYDSNVPSAPSFIGLGDNIQKEDSRVLVAAFGDYRIIQEEDWNLGLIGSIYDSWHFRLGEYNVQDYMGGVYSNRAVGDYILGVRYEYHNSLLDGDHLASDHRLVPNITYAGYDWGHTTVYYEYNTASLNAPALIPEQVQSGDFNAVGITQAIYTFGGEGRIYAGYRYQDADTDGSDFDRHSHMVTGRIERPLGYGVIADAEVRHFWDDYASPNSLDFFDRPREDTRVEVRTGIQKAFPRNFTLRLDYTYLGSNSNTQNLFGVNFYEFDRHIVSTQAIYDF